MPTNAEKAVEIFKKLEGKNEGTGEWLQVDQSRINTFADATLDHQFIHVDPEKAAQFSPYKVTIAHGYLTLSLVPHLQGGIPMADPKAYEGIAAGINYGLDKVRFPSPVKVNSRVRAHREMISAELVNPNTILLKQKVTVEIENESKPACVAETLVRLIYA
ncbi:MAG TPA: MaoC family dehydratase [Polyangiales bacterium]|jgi:acyl dehydratase|nr:MaoC family dehydratase [Polyangiales bacterium]